MHAAADNLYRRTLGLTGRSGQCPVITCDVSCRLPIGDIAMQMRIIWGKILPGQLDAFEAAFKRALEIRGEVKGLKGQWLLRDENDPDAGYLISQWESADDMRAFWDSKKRNEAMAVLQPFYVNQYTITNCTVRIASSY
jgi:heme-degrading monooxygenase HmoA